MSSRPPLPTNIAVAHKSFGPLHTHIVCTFTLGFDHIMSYERSERVLGGTVIITLDGKDVMRESLYEVAIGKYTQRFEIEREPIGLIKITGFLLAMSVKVLINNVEVIRA